MANGKRADGWWYPWIYVAGMGVVVVVNAVLIFFAISTYSGLETEGHYEKGLAYDETIEKARRMEAMGWSSAVRFEVAPTDRGVADGDATATGRALATLAGPDGAPLDGLDVRLVVTRPTRAGLDRDVVLAPVDSGTYVAPLDLPLRGQWDFRLVAIGGGSPYQKIHRIVVP